MASRTVTVVIDDLDDTETEDGENVEFSLDGVNYEIDLSAAHAEELRAGLQVYVEAGRAVGGNSKVKPKATAASTPKKAASSDTSAIREWARANGIEIGEKGRIAIAVREQYEAARAAA